jgi:hypothetical protein
MMRRRCCASQRERGSDTLADSVFFLCAVLGGGVFVIRTLLQLVGFGADTDDLHHDADAGFRILSLQGLSAFFMMFGLVGLALVRESKIGEAPALGIAALAGVGSMWLIGKLFGMMTKLQSSGTLNMQNAIGQSGTVYLTVPKSGRGKVEVVVQGRLGVFEATTHLGGDIATGARVRVVAIESGDTLIVEPLDLNLLP